MLSLSLHRHFERKSWLAHKLASRLFIDAPGTCETQTKSLAAVLICRDEEDYIDEWIRYHVLAGVRHFYIYDNGSVDSTVAKASVHDREGVRIKIHPWKIHSAIGKYFISPQDIAYVHAVLNYGRKHRWMAFIDTDEFLVPRKHLTIVEALEHLGEHSNISLPWTEFGHCGHVNKPADPCLFAYTLKHQHNRYKYHHFKCILDPCKIIKQGVHDCFTADMGEGTANDKGQVAPISARGDTEGFVSSEYIQLNHYETKSIKEHERKLEKILYGALVSERIGRVAPTIGRLSENVIEDTAAIDFLRRHGIENSDEYGLYISNRVV